MAEPALSAQVVSRRFGRRWAVRRVSAEFASGRAAAIVGHNGAGKSTLLSVLAGRMRPTEGHVMAMGAAFAGFPPARTRRALAYLGHAPFVYPDLTGRENLSFGASLYGARPSLGQVDDALARVDLTLVGGHAAHTYSRGMTQRLAFARLLLVDAPIWLLDEPLTGLDRDGQALVVATVAEAKARGTCVVCVTHALDVLRPVIDEVVALERGRHRARAQVDA